MKTFKPKTLTYVDFYNDYTSRLMLENPNYLSERNGRVNYIKHYSVFYYNRGRRVDIINYDVYKEIVITYFKLAGEKIIAGKTLNLLNDLGYITIKIVEKNPLKQPVDWGESYKLKQELINRGEELEEIGPARDKKGNVKKPLKGEIIYKKYKKWLVYYTDDSYILIDWIKPLAAKKISKNGVKTGRWIPNLLFYEFKPSRGGSDRGFAKKVSKAIKENPYLLQKYEYHKQ